MPKTPLLAPLSQPGSLAIPASVDDESNSDILPLWLRTSPDGLTRPTLSFGGAESVLSAAQVGACDGRWQLHLFSFWSEARQALQTIRLLLPEMPSEVSPRTTGEGLLLIRMGDGDFDCRIMDRRGNRGAEAPRGSWELPQEMARRAALHMPLVAFGRAAQVARHLVAELHGPVERAELCQLMGCRSRLDERSLGRIRLEEVVGAANRLLEPTGLELASSDRRVLSFIDDYLAAAPFQMDGIIDRIAHDLVAQLAERGGVE